MVTSQGPSLPLATLDLVWGGCVPFFHRVLPLNPFLPKIRGDQSGDVHSTARLRLCHRRMAPAQSARRGANGCSYQPPARSKGISYVIGNTLNIQSFPPKISGKSRLGIMPWLPRARGHITIDFDHRNLSPIGRLLMTSLALPSTVGNRKVNKWKSGSPKPPRPIVADLGHFTRFLSRRIDDCVVRFSIISLPCGLWVSSRVDQGTL